MYALTFKSYSELLKCEHLNCNYNKRQIIIHYSPIREYFQVDPENIYTCMC